MRSPVRISLLLLLGLWLQGISTPAAEAKVSDSVLEGLGPAQFILDLADGSRFLGTSETMLLSISLNRNRLDIPWRRVRSLLLETNSLQGILLLRNGERLIGEINLGRIELKTVVGKISVRRDLIREIRPTFSDRKQELNAKPQARVYYDEPMVEGHSFREWIGQTRATGTGIMKDDLEERPKEQDEITAEENVRRIGAAGVPFLLHLIRRGNGASAVFGFRILRELAQDAVPELQILMENPDDFTVRCATRALGAIGSSATNAIPALVDQLQRGNLTAAESLGEIGREAGPAIPIILYWQQQAAVTYDQPLIKALGEIGGVEALPSLMHILERIWAGYSDGKSDMNENQENRERVTIIAIGKLGVNAAPAVPLLAKKLRETDLASLSHLNRTIALVEALGNIGPASKEAMPILQKLTQTSERPFFRLQERTKTALARIGSP